MKTGDPVSELYPTAARDTHLTEVREHGVQGFDVFLGMVALPVPEARGGARAAEFIHQLSNEARLAPHSPESFCAPALTGLVGSGVPVVLQFHNICGFGTGVAPWHIACRWQTTLWPAVLSWCGQKHRDRNRRRAAHASCHASGAHAVDIAMVVPL